MPDVAGVLRLEIVRLARKEVRREVIALRKSLVDSRRKVSELKRDVVALEKRVKVLEARQARRVDAEPKPAPDTNIRFSPKWVAADRKRLGLSAGDYGRLVGVSGPTILRWETGKSKPRKEQLAKWAAFRGIGKREARHRLELLNRANDQRQAKND